MAMLTRDDDVDKPGPVLKLLADSFGFLFNPVTRFFRALGNKPEAFRIVGAALLSLAGYEIIADWSGGLVLLSPTVIAGVLGGLTAVSVYRGRSMSGDMIEVEVANG